MRRLALLVAVASVAALSGLNVPASAANGGRSDEHRRIVDYWTPERQANAIPRDMSPNPKAKPGTGGGGTGSAVTGATWTLGGDVAATTGKVFFKLGGVDYVCSGSAVDSAHGNLVLTAGHCLHDGDGGGFATYWMFAPRWKNFQHDPVLGRWTAKALYTTGNWAGDWPTSGSGFNDDAGFAVVERNAGEKLEDVLRSAAVGATVPTVDFNSNHTATELYSAFGYPAARPYQGQTLTYCAGTTRLDRDGLDTMALACNMTGGSSGGPWFTGYTHAGSTRVIKSVNSYGYSSMKATMFGPIFDADEKAAYDAANTTTPSCVPSEAAPCLSVG